MTASVWDPATVEIPVVNATSTLYPQVFSATAGQTLFNITNFQYVVGTGSLLIFVNGVFQIITKNFTETSISSFTMTTTELQVGDEVVALGFVGITATTPPTIAANITYGGTTLSDILLNNSELIVNSYVQLRTIQHIFWSFAYLTGAVVRGDGLGGGFYYYDATDITSPDNGSTIIVASDGGRWKLIVSTTVLTTQPIGDNTVAPATTKFVQQAHTSSLTHMIHPSVDGKWKDLYKAGIRPGFHNQQWGGGIVGWELNNGATDSMFTFDSATCQIEDYNPIPAVLGLGNLSTNIWRSQGFKVGENMTIQAIWIKLYKVVNPVDNIKLIIALDDGTGKPSGFVGITNGTATLINNRQVTSKLDGEWYRFVFATPPALVSTNQYHLAINKSGAVDATNFTAVKNTITGKYPFGNNCLSDGATWTTGTALTQLDFIVEPVAANQMFRSTGGLVDTACFVFNEGTQITHSKVFIDRTINFATSKNFTQLLRVSNIIAGKTLLDIGWGINHDRLVITCDTGTGFLRATLYDANKAVTTIVGANSVVGTALMDIGIVLRSMNDGQDFLSLSVNGNLYVQIIGVSFNISQNLRDLGTRWTGGGFPVAPVWTQDMNFASLPSAQGWTFTGTATEANVFQVTNNKLYQNKDGYAATDTGFYTKPATALNNSIGWIVRWRLRDLFSDNLITAAVSNALTVTINDGTKTISVAIQEYFLWTGSTTTDFTVQLDTKTLDTEYILIGKGSDYFLFANHRLIVDGTGKLVTTTATNSIIFGDVSATSAENADAIWTDFSYFNGGSILPVVSTGMILHESGYLAGNHSAYFTAIYNAGSPIGIKTFWNQERNYVQDIPWTINLLAITISSPPSGAAGIYLRAPELESYTLGSNFLLRGLITLSNLSAAVQIAANISIDGSINIANQTRGTTSSVAFAMQLSMTYISVLYTGLHKFEVVYGGFSGGANAQCVETSRGFVLTNTSNLY